MKFLTFFISLFFFSNAYAVKTNKCVEKFEISLTNYEFYKTGIVPVDPYGEYSEYIDIESESDGYKTLTETTNLSIIESFYLTEKKNSKCYYKAASNAKGTRTTARIDGSDKSPELIITFNDDIKFRLWLASYSNVDFSIVNDSFASITSLEAFEAWEDYDYYWVSIGNAKTVNIKTVQDCSEAFAEMSAILLATDEIYDYGHATDISIKSVETNLVEQGLQVKVSIYAAKSEDGPVTFNYDIIMSTSTCKLATDKEGYTIWPKVSLI